jgi:UDP-glucose 4-epimerase
MDDIFKKERIDTVVHTAYALTPIHNKDLMEDINKGGTKNILEASAKEGVKQILYTSSTTAYGFHPDNDTPLTEDSPLRGNDDFIYAKNKKEIEGIMQEFSSENSDISVTIVRPCFVIGPGFNNTLAEHLKKKFVLMPSNTLPFQFVHEDDLINVMMLLLEKRIAGVYNVSAEDTLTFSEMVSTLGNTRLSLPWSVIYPLNNSAWYLRLSFLTKFPSPSMRMMINPWIASNEKLVRDTGYRFLFDSRQAFRDFANSV